MTLGEAKKLLSENNISFEMCEFENETAYWHHVSMFPYTKNAKPCKVIALIIRSNNGKKNIELQFVDKDNNGNFTFDDLLFGEYFYELFDCQDEVLQQSIIDEINSIVSNSVIVIVSNDLTKEKWCGDAIFDKREEDGFGLPGYEKALQRINKEKGFFAKHFGTKMQYEIYDWNTYQCIEK